MKTGLDLRAAGIGAALAAAAIAGFVAFALRERAQVQPRISPKPPATAGGSRPASPSTPLAPAAPLPDAAPPLSSAPGPALPSRITRGALACPTGGLFAAAVSGDVAAIKQKAENGLSVDEQEPAGKTPLACALFAERAEAAAALIELGADVNLPIHDQITPLMIAAELGLAASTELLLARGARPNDADRFGQTAIMRAARVQMASVVTSLHRGGSRLEARCARGMTALLHAVDGGDDPTTVNALLERGASLDARDVNGATALLIAAGRGHGRVVRLLLDRGAPLDARDHAGLSALDYVVRPRSTPPKEILVQLKAGLDLLIERGIDPRLGQNPRTTPILFRDELDAILLRRGLGPLPSYEPATHQPDAPPPPSASKPVSLRILARQPRASSRALPARLYDQALLGYRGWTHVPNIVHRVELRGLALTQHQRATLAGDAAGLESWTVDDVLLMESYQGSRRVSARFAGTVETVELEGKSVARLGSPGFNFGPRAINVSSLLTFDSDRLVLSLLDYGGTAEIGNVFLHLDGKDAAATLKKAELRVVGP